jgi:hypothetical protein
MRVAREYLYAIGGGGMARKSRSVAVRLGLVMRRRWLCGASTLGFVAALAHPMQSWAGLRRPICGGDSGLTPGSGSVQDIGNRSPGLSF